MFTSSGALRVVAFSEVGRALASWIVVAPATTDKVANTGAVR